jgi:hypothetical protein
MKRTKSDLQNEIVRLRSALEFYADPANWNADRCHPIYTSVWIDHGQRAEQVLSISRPGELEVRALAAEAERDAVIRLAKEAEANQPILSRQVAAMRLSLAFERDRADQWEGDWRRTMQEIAEAFGVRHVWLAAAEDRKRLLSLHRLEDEARLLRSSVRSMAPQIRKLTFRLRLARNHRPVSGALRQLRIAAACSRRAAVPRKALARLEALARISAGAKSPRPLSEMEIRAVEQAAFDQHYQAREAASRE